ncbi:hypothetical protein AKO1_006700 [Acrasis kona]|uniref:Uncharacterized protein n=1 Tax=Acrasis kona TaxID=1008807 RepID=A0AAW2ZMW7_9EUKA
MISKLRLSITVLILYFAFVLTSSIDTREQNVMPTLDHLHEQLVEQAIQNREHITSLTYQDVEELKYKNIDYDGRALPISEEHNEHPTQIDESDKYSLISIKLRELQAYMRSNRNKDLDAVIQSKTSATEEMELTDLQEPIQVAPSLVLVENQSIHVAKKVTFAQEQELELNSTPQLDQQVNLHDTLLEPPNSSVDYKF